MSYADPGIDKWVESPVRTLPQGLGQGVTNDIETTPNREAQIDRRCHQQRAWINSGALRHEAGRVGRYAVV
ncbi:hypothetical protein CUC44_10955 [Aeromonas lusitana]|uniref:Uncharacterized protein n=1 Tax=Aeromonas lusitana TaxID=931529 RepID=A0A2M8H9D2_9GAMM|nr:hypothetical protein CUC44_10955 [Aeromonas lusitana]